MKKTDSNHGLTIVELLLAISAASILILTVGIILFMGFRSWRMNNAFAAMRRDSAYAFSLMARDVREADYDTLTPGNPLILPSPITGKSLVTYTWSSGNQTLEYNDGTDDILVIPTNVTAFTSEKNDDSDGVLLTLELLNTEFNIALTNQVLINTRN